LISSLCTVFDFLRKQKQNREKKSKTVQRSNQKQYREEIKNSTEKKSKTVQRRNQKQYRLSNTNTTIKMRMRTGAQ
jgi:predicted metal-dependent hydrolase